MAIASEYGQLAFLIFKVLTHTGFIIAIIIHLLRRHLLYLRTKKAMQITLGLPKVKGEVGKAIKL